MIDKICFGMPKDREYAMACAAVVQDYRMQLKRQLQMKQRPPIPYEIWVAWPDPGMKWMRPLLWEAQFLDEYHPVRGEWEYAYDFEAGREAAYELSMPTGRPASDILGVIVGAAPPLEGPVIKGLPELEAMTVDGESNTVCVLPGPEAQAMVELLELHYPGNKVLLPGPEVFDVDRPDWNLAEMVKYLAPAQMVVGRRSWVTMLAAMAGKWLLEFYPTDVHEKWFSKWQTNRYLPIYADQFPKTLIWTGVESLWDRWTSSTLRGSTGGIIPTAQ